MKSVLNARSVREKFISLALFMMVGLGCSGTGTGCSTLTPFPMGTRYSGPKTDNAINLRLSPAGINYLNTNWQTLVEAFAPGRQLAGWYSLPDRRRH